MKFFLFLFIFPFASTAQKINGISPFKIGTTTTAIIDSLKYQGYSYSESPDWFYMLRPKRTKSIILLIEDTSGYIRNSTTKRTKDVKVYNVGSIDNKHPHPDNLVLSFYKDTLCSIISNYYQADFTRFIKARVGPPKDSIHTTNANCVQFKNLIIADTISTYTDNPDLRVFEARGFYFDRLCSKKFKYFFEISNPRITKKLRQLSHSFDIIFPYFFL